MAIAPIVRYMLLCNDWRVDPENENRITIVGLLSNIHPRTGESYPLIVREICVMLLLTDGYGQGEFSIECMNDESGEVIFASGPRPIAFSADPLHVMGVPFRIHDLVVPSPGFYTVEFRYDGEVVEERLLRAR